MVLGLKGKQGFLGEEWRAREDSYRTDILNKSFYSELLKLKRVMI
jgi:hypothetical protein